MIHRHLFYVLLFMGAVVYAWLARDAYKDSSKSPLLGNQAPLFTLKDEQGVPVALADFFGNVVLVHLWATWCEPCAEEIPSLEKLKQKFENQNFILLPISVDAKGMAAVEEFRKKIPFHFSVLLDEKNEVADLYGTHRLPESYLVDSEGIIVKKFVGPQNWQNSKIEKEITHILTQ